MLQTLNLPDWLPWWVPLAVLLPVLLYLLLFLLMPFSVFGVKGRLDAIEARLEEIQDELRLFAPPPRRPEAGQDFAAPPPVHAPAPPRAAPLPPEPAHERPPPRADAPPPLRAEPPPPPRRRLAEEDEEPRRIEPRLGWPRS